MPSTMLDRDKIILRRSLTLMKGKSNHTAHYVFLRELTSMYSRHGDIVIMYSVPMTRRLATFK
jgi:hypothetical protein